MKFVARRAFLLTLACGAAFAQAPVPPQPTPESASITVQGKALSVKYGSPAVTGRKVFDEGGPIRKDATFPVWRAGGDAATAFHTDADLMIGNLSVPKGDYTLYVNLKDMAAWELVINKQTGQWGTVYDAAQDFGRVKMTAAPSDAVVEKLKYTLTAAGANKARLLLQWERQGAAVDIIVK